ncbi:MAG: hypothetical protein J0M24_23425 [Verrucomicrobia bacterium]|nr:hypothetical protein [Verrucomicrobiota bacterium]
MSSLPIYVYVDVDDTFVRSASSKRIPMPAAIHHVGRLQETSDMTANRRSSGSELAESAGDELRWT